MKQPIVVQELRHSFSFSQTRLLIWLVGVLALVGLIYLGQSSQAVVTGARVLELQAELERLQRTNAELEYEIATLTTPARLAERARALGLRPATMSQTIYIVVPDYPASSRLVRRVSASPVASPDFSSGTLWDDWLTRLGLGRAGAAEATAP